MSCQPTWIFVVIGVLFVAWLVWSDKEHQKEKFLFDSCDAARPNAASPRCICDQCKCEKTSEGFCPCVMRTPGTTHVHSDGQVHTHRGGCVSHTH